MPSPFSSHLPQLQLAWDSTSIGLLKECPRKYYYRLICGWSSPQISHVHLYFGLLYHAALEFYDHQRASGTSFEAALRATVRKVLSDTWLPPGRPWASGDEYKNRFTLLRSVVWYLEQFRDDPMQTVVLANGRPAVELSFQCDLPFRSRHDEPFVLCGHLDRVGTFMDQVWINDRKTTKSALDQRYFDQYLLDNQFSTYSFAGQITYAQPIAGIVVDAAQIGVNFTRYHRQPISRQDWMLQEWLRGLGELFLYAEHCARAEFWPLNEKSCNNFGGCAYRHICSKSPAMREPFLRKDFLLQEWNPLQARGDI